MTLPEPLVRARRVRWHRAGGLQRGRMPPALRPWILSDRSLTAQLRARCAGRFRLEILRQCRARPRPDEARALRVDPSAPAIVREVALCCGNTPLVVARTVLPAASLQGGCRKLATLGRQPLGAVLFADRSTRRGPRAVTCLSPRGVGLTGARGGAGAIWGRRAVFRYRGGRLLVCEFFLPELAELVCSPAVG